MNLHHFNPELKIHDDSYLWRYMNAEKALNFFSDNEIYFARLDKFDDPLEGLPLVYRGNLQVKNVIRCEENEINFTDYCNKTQWLSRDAIKKYQNGVYVSCWYLTENDSKYELSDHHESLAMWNWHDPNSFVIRVSFGELLSLISESLKTFHQEGVFAANYGKIHYLNYNEYAKLINSTDKLFMPTLIKHNSYKYENELRFILLRNGTIDADLDKFGIKLKMRKKFNEVKPLIEIITHPDMDEKKFKQYKNQFAQLGFDIKVSSIVSKKISMGLLNNLNEPDR